MELKRIVAPSARAANNEILERFGPDVLIVSSRKVDRDRTEIIVAVEQEPDTSDRTAPGAEQPSSPATQERRFGNLLAHELNRAGQPVSERQAPVERESVPAPADGGEIVELIRSELRELRAELKALRASRQGSDPTGGFDRASLAAAGLADGTIEQLLGHIGQSADQKTLAEALTGMLDEMQAPAWQQKMHLFGAPGGADCSAEMLAAAHQFETTHGPGQATVVSLHDGQSSDWPALQQRCLHLGLGCLQITDDVRLAQLLPALLGDHGAVFIDARPEDLQRFTHILDDFQSFTMHHLVLGEGYTSHLEKVSSRNWASMILSDISGGTVLMPALALSLRQGLPISYVCAAQASGFVKLGRDLGEVARRALEQISSPASRDNVFTKELQS